MTPMYLDDFGLTDAPFSIAPDPRYLYMSPRHREALAHLMFGVQSDNGFVVLTGDVGAGKTTVCRCLLEQLPDNCDVALIFNPKLSVGELLSTICGEFRIPVPETEPSIKVYVDRINAYLLDAHARGRMAVLIIDEAQSLGADVLEQVRLLTNLETNQRKLLRILLLGQPQLRDMLARPDMRQLAQRIVARYHLEPLSRQETAAYVAHRLGVAGAHHELFSPAAIGRLYRLSGGVPRLVNVLADRALLGAYVQDQERVDAATVRRAGREVLGEQEGRRPWGLWRSVGLALGAVGSVAALAVVYFGDGEMRAMAYPAALTRAGAAEPDAAPVLPVLNISSPPALKPATLDAMLALAAATEDRGRATAYRTLLRLWGIAPGVVDAGDACQGVQALGLACIAAHGGIEDLRQLNRPVVLALKDAAGVDVLAALTALDDRSASITLGEASRDVSFDALAERWTGSFVSFGMPRSEERELIRADSRGLGVERLKQQLALVRHETLPKESEPVYDEETARQVRRFQFAEGLPVDGVAGPKTLQQLARVVTEMAPKLDARRRED